MKVIPFATKYAVSEDGFIHSRAKSKNNLYKRMTGVLNNSTYYRVNISTDSDGVKKFLVHRLVALTYLPNPDKLPEVNHIDGNKLNNEVSNLEWVTREQNIRHSFDIGLNSSVGERNGRSTITEATARDIKSLLKSTHVAEIVRITGVNRNIVSKIKANKIWKHV